MSLKEYDLVCIANKGTSDWVLGTIARKVTDYAQGRAVAVIHSKKPLPKSKAYFYLNWYTYVKDFHAKTLPENGAKLVYFTHPRHTPLGDDKIMEAFAHADRVIFMGSLMAQEFIAKGLNPAKTAILPGAAELKVFPPHHRSGKGAVGFCSAYYERKNPQLIFDLVKAMPHRKFIHLGKNWEKFSGFTAICATPNYTYIDTSYKNYPEYYSKMDVFVSPSFLEGGPIPLIEAMMSNVYPVASRTGFAEDIIQDGINGLLFHPEITAKDLAALIESAFAQKQVDIRATTSKLTWNNFAANLLALANQQLTDIMPQKPKVFIHVNDKQIFAAKIAKYTIENSSKHSDKFDVEFISLDDHPHLKKKEGKEYIRKGMSDKWKNDDLQSFTPLRFLPPQLMGYEGKAIVVDPDVFGIGDIYDLLSRDMGGKAILCRKVIDAKFEKGYYWGTSVMLLDCAKLKHWKWEQTIDDLFAKKIDYRDWMSLFLENEEIIGEIEEEWNSFDKLEPQTKLLHNTGRLTQPWKTGLPVDFQNAEKFYKKPNKKPSLLQRILGRNKKPVNVSKLPQLYLKHPDPAQIEFFFTKLDECLANGAVNKKELREEIRKGNIRKDALAVMEEYVKPNKQKKAS